MSQKELLVERSSLKGKIKLSGAKNSALRLQAASILTDEELILDNFPNGLSDVKIHNEMLESLGKRVHTNGDKLIISGSINTNELIWNKRSIRNTLLIWGAILARKGFSKVPLPGGCKIGERKYDLHQMVLESLGARVWVEGDYLCAESKGQLTGADIYLPLRSTGATENAILSSSLAIGKTTIWNPHIRPEILDLIDMLNKMGAKIEVRGNESIVVEGVEKLHATTHKVIPDNMEALTFLGIDNFNIDKKERVIVDEANANNDLINQNAEIMLNARKKAVDEINKKFNLNITVKLRNDKVVSTYDKEEVENEL